MGKCLERLGAAKKELALDGLVYKCAYVSVHEYVKVNVYAHVQVCVELYYVYSNRYICVCICMYMLIHTCIHISGYVCQYILIQICTHV